MKEYKEKLAQLDNDTSDELISNGSKEHAQALIYQFLDKAKKSVNIISTNLSIYNDSEIVKALNVALYNNVKIKILLDNYQGNTIADNVFLNKCLANDYCEVKTYDKPLKAHIVTRDDKAFRYCNDPGSNIAVACFNRPKTVKNAIDNVFSDFFDEQSAYIT